MVTGEGGELDMERTGDRLVDSWGSGKARPYPLACCFTGSVIIWMHNWNKLDLMIHRTATP